LLLKWVPDPLGSVAFIAAKAAALIEIVTIRPMWERVAARSLPGSIKVQDQSDVETLKAELTDKKIMLADIESGKVSLGGAFENREAGVRHRIAEIESQLASLKARRYPYD
jgi:hypothetical protein